MPVGIVYKVVGGLELSGNLYSPLLAHHTPNRGCLSLAWQSLFSASSSGFSSFSDLVDFCGNHPHPPRPASVCPVCFH